MTKNDRRGFIIHLIPEPDCSDSIKALRELLKRALRSWGLRCVTFLRPKKSCSETCEASVSGSMTRAVTSSSPI
jgi:hypothetical protein